MEGDLKKTPLAGEHEKLGARMVGFAGYYMPVSYSSIIAEHEAVRERAGIFDVSHMGEFIVEGDGALDFVNMLVTNDCSRLTPGAILYTVMCRENGTVVDDLLVYDIGGDDGRRFLLVVNAANIDKDFSHVSSFASRDVSVKNVSEDRALIAVQGPLSRDLLMHCPLFSSIKGAISSLPYYHHVAFNSSGDEILVSRTGYTGELGYEIMTPPQRAVEFWRGILECGREKEILPAGLAARDTLRFEASFCLYGHELDEETNPLEAGLGWVVKLNKGEFVGRKALLKSKSEGLKKHLVGFELEGRNIARQGFEVLKNGEKAGVVTSGSFSPTLKKSLCMAYMMNDTAASPGEYAITVRKKMVGAHPVPLPFYKSRAKD